MPISPKDNAALHTLFERWIGYEQPTGLHASEPESNLPVFLLEQDIKKLSDGSTVTLRFSDIGYVTKSGDSVDAAYEARLKLGSISRSLLKSGKIGQRSHLISSVMKLANHDQELSVYLNRDNYTWEGGESRVLVGATSWSYSAFDTIARFRCEGASWDEEEVDIKSKGFLKRLGRPLQRATYGGFQASLYFDTAGGNGYVDCGNVGEIGSRNWGISIYFKMSATGANGALCCKRATLSGGTDKGLSIFRNTGGDLKVRINDGTNEWNVTAGSGGEYADDNWHMLDVMWDRENDTGYLYVDGAEVHSSSIATIGTVISSLPLVFGANSNKTGSFADEIWIAECRIWNSIPKLGFIKSKFNRALQGTEKGLEFLFRFSEYGGTDILNEQATTHLVGGVFGGSGTNVSFGNNLDMGSASATVLGWVRYDNGIGAEQVAWAKKQTSASGQAGWAFGRMTSAPQIRFSVSDGTTQRTIQLSSLPTNMVPDDTRWIGLAMVVDRGANEFRAYWLDHARGTLTLIDTKDITGDGSYGNAVTCYMGQYGDLSGDLNGVISGPCLFSPEVLTSGTIRDALSGQVIDLDPELPTPSLTVASIQNTSGAHLYMMDENTGTTITDEIGSVNGTATLMTWIDQDGDLTLGGITWDPTLEGGLELQGLPKPICVGYPRRCTPVLVDYFNGIYQLSDPGQGAIQAIPQGYAGSLELDEGALNDYIEDLTNATIDLTAAQTTPLTFSVKGVKDGSGNWIKRTGAAFEYLFGTLLNLATGTDYNDVGLAALDDSYPAEMGLYLDARPHLAEEAFDILCAPNLFWGQELGGWLGVGRIKDPRGEARKFDITEANIESMSRMTGVRPVWKRRIGFDRTWGPHKNHLGAATTQNRTLHEKEWRYVFDRDIDTRDDYDGSDDREQYSSLTRRKDANLVLEELMELDSNTADQKPLEPWKFSVSRFPFRAEVGDVFGVTRDDEKLDFSETTVREFLILGYKVTFGQDVGYPRTEFEAWG